MNWPSPNLIIGLLAMAMLKRTAKQIPGGVSGWVWPMPNLDGDTADDHGVRTFPEISDSAGPNKRRNPDGSLRAHLGVDIMYRRIRPRRAQDDRGSRDWYVPPGTPVIAARDGVIWKSGQGQTGWWAIIAHPGLGLATYYTHMERLIIPVVNAGNRHLTAPLRAGAQLGLCGASPLDGPRGLRHLHFEIRKGTDRINPEPAMHSWRKI